DLNKFVSLWEAITLSPVGETLQRNSNCDIRRKKFKEVMHLPPDPDLTRHSTNATHFDELSEEIEVFENLPGCCESVVLEKLDRTGRLVDGLTWEEIERVANVTNLCYLNGYEAGKDFSTTNLHIIRKLMSIGPV